MSVNHSFGIAHGFRENGWVSTHDHVSTCPLAITSVSIANLFTEETPLNLFPTSSQNSFRVKEETQLRFLLLVSTNITLWLLGESN